MAIALEVIYSIEDDDGDIATTSIKVPNGFSIAQYTEFAAAMADIVQNLLDGALRSADLCLSVDISAIGNNTLVEASNADEIAAFQFITTDSRRVNVNLPAYSADNFTIAGSDDLDQSDADVMAFITAMTSGLAVTGGTIEPCDVGEDDIVDLLTAREAYRSSGRRKGN